MQRRLIATVFNQLRLAAWKSRKAKNETLLAGVKQEIFGIKRSIQIFNNFRHINAEENIKYFKSELKELNEFKSKYKQMIEICEKQMTLCRIFILNTELLLLNNDLN